jgi:hypothetical protein
MDSCGGVAHGVRRLFAIRLGSETPPRPLAPFSSSFAILIFGFAREGFLFPIFLHKSPFKNNVQSFLTVDLSIRSAEKAKKT